MDITSYILGKKAGGGSAPTGTIEITENGTTNVSNYAYANVDVQPDLEAKSITITENTTTTITPTSGKDGLSSVEITTDVQSGEKFAPQTVYFSGGVSYRPADTAITGADIQKHMSFKNAKYFYCEGCMGLDNINMSNDEDNNEDVTFYQSFKSCTNLETVDFSNFKGNLSSCWGMFLLCSKLKEVNLCNAKCTSNTNLGSFFNGCSSMEKIDIRSMQLELITNSTYYNTWVFNVPDNCLIIVRDNNAKQWALARNANLTNVKTADEYEGS